MYDGALRQAGYVYMSVSAFTVLPNNKDFGPAIPELNPASITAC